MPVICESVSFYICSFSFGPELILLFQTFALWFAPVTPGSELCCRSRVGRGSLIRRPPLQILNHQQDTPDTFGACIFFGLMPLKKSQSITYVSERFLYRDCRPIHVRFLYRKVIQYCPQGKVAQRKE